MRCGCRTEYSSAKNFVFFISTTLERVIRAPWVHPVFENTDHLLGLGDSDHSPQAGMKTSGTCGGRIGYTTSEQRILGLRILLGVSLMAGAAVTGFLSYYLLRGNESDFAASQFESIATQALSQMTNSFSRMNAGATNFARQYQYEFPNETMWPNVALEGFYDLASGMGDISSLDNLVFLPIIFDLSKQASFEDFMYDYYAAHPENPPGSGVSPAGPGIWAIDSKKIGQPGMFYHDTTGNVYEYESRYNSSFVEAAFQITFSDDITPAQLGYNSHTVEMFGAPLDDMLDCIRDSENYTVAREACGSFSEAVPLPPPTLQNPSPVATNMQAFIFQPIVLENVTETGDIKAVQLGSVVGAVNWKTLLSRAVPSYISGVDCVVTTDTLAFTYTMESGVPVFLGIGDWHDSHYDRYAESIDLLKETNTKSTTSYTLTYYPRRQFFRQFETSTPQNTATGAVAVFIYCILIFVAYDWAVRRESTRKELVLDTKRRFVRFISHEMRTPLNTVHLGLKLLEMEMRGLMSQLSVTDLAALVKSVQHSLTEWTMMIDDILGNSESAVDVLNDLLNYDKIEMGTLRLDFASVSIWHVVEVTARAFMMQAKQKGVELLLVGECWSARSADDQEGADVGRELSEKDPYNVFRAVGDGTRIAQVLRNLVSNALKFTPENGQVIVQATLVPNGLPNAFIDVPPDKEFLLNDPRAGSIRIAVIDSGAGLSEEQLAQICSEGVQFNANQLQAGGGSGLGLYISKGLAEQHGGTLTVTSEGLGRGSTFTLELPLFKSDLLLVSGSSGSSRSIATGDGLDVRTNGSSSPRSAHRLRILVVDDASSNRKFLVRILQNKGFVCYSAEDGQKGVDAFLRLRSEGTQLDAVVMDFEMPVMNGPTATKVLRDLGCRCFIAGVTGNVLPADIDHFKAQGADTVLAKPLNLDTFEVAVAQFRFSMDRADETDAHGEMDYRSVEQVAPLVAPLRISSPRSYLESRADMEINLDRMENGEHTQDSTFRQDTEE